MTYPKALPLALPEVHMFVADVFAETAEELRRIEKERGRKVADCHRQWQRRWQSRLRMAMAKGLCHRKRQREMARGDGKGFGKAEISVY